MEEIPPPPHRQVSLCTGSAGPGSDYSCALSEGCVLLHINDKDQRGSKKSLSYAHLFKKSQPHNAVGRSPQESSESKAGVEGGGWASITKERNNPRFLSPKTRATQFRNAVGLHQNQGYLHAFQWVYSCIKQEAPPHCTVISPLLLSLSLLLKQ